MLLKKIIFYILMPLLPMIFFMKYMTQEQDHLKPADIAEIFKSTDELEAGELVCISGMDNEHVVRSDDSQMRSVIGVVSTEPATVLNSEEKGYPVVVAGRAPVKVCDEAGPINRGDLLTSSSMPGFAMKAENPRIGTIIGKALEEFDGFEGKIMVLIDLQ